MILLPPYSRAAVSAIIAALGFTCNSHAVDLFWDNPAEGLWSDPLNWSTDIAPTSADAGRINNGGTAVIDDTQNVATGFLILGDAVDRSGNLRMTGGTLTTSFDIRIGGNSATSGGTGVFTQSGGSILMNGGNVNVGFGTTAAGVSSTGTYNISGGSLVVNSGTIFAVGNRGVGTVNQTGGSIYVRGGSNPAAAVLQLGRNTATVPASGTYTLSGGTLAATNLQFGNAVGGTGSTNTFNLQGTGKLLTNAVSVINTGATNTFNFTGGTLTAANINIPLTNNGGALSPATLDFPAVPGDPAFLENDPIGTTTFTANYTQSSLGKLSIDIAGAGSNDFVDIGAAPAVVASASISGTVAVNLLNGFDPAQGSTFDILSADTISFGATVLGSTAGGRFFEPSTVAGADGRQVLRLTVVPEPATAGLLVAAGALIVFRRPRRA